MAVARGIRELEDISLVRELAASGEARHIRLAARLSQSELARACNTSVSAISRWETGHRRPRGAGARQYAQVLLALRDRE